MRHSRFVVVNEEEHWTIVQGGKGPHWLLCHQNAGYVCGH